MKKYKYNVMLGNEVVNKGETTSKDAAINAFKGFGRRCYGSIEEVNPDYTSQIGHKQMGKSLNCW